MIRKEYLENRFHILTCSPVSHFPIRMQNARYLPIYATPAAPGVKTITPGKSSHALLFTCHPRVRIWNSGSYLTRTHPAVGSRRSPPASRVANGPPYLIVFARVSRICVDLEWKFGYVNCLACLRASGSQGPEAVQIFRVLSFIQT